MHHRFCGNDGRKAQSEMPHLLNIWPSITARLLKKPENGRILALFDYDGTLTPIAARPEDALLPPETQQQLTALAAHPRCIVGIVSGRSLADLTALADIPNLIYAGNHGMEIRGPGLNFTHPDAITARAALERTQSTLAAALSHIPGIIIEDKGLTLTVHYRAPVNAAPDNQRQALTREVDAAVTSAAAHYVETGQLRLTRGKMVLEVRPAIPWDKGKAIEKIRENYNDRPIPLYFGDDRTDEDGFRAVQQMGGLAVFVGPPRQSTTALHQLESPKEVSQTLRLLLEEL